jgi:hypothetical protein
VPLEPASVVLPDGVEVLPPHAATTTNTNPIEPPTSFFMKTSTAKLLRA